ncbi:MULTISPECIES: LysR substrate-binding domain-containing protein [Rhizobium]|uniref:LysR substrate-binding domain-containing protein n=1 Tax=Rhizobium rhododendri TaxID=2506430 RepID=A0ABY8IRI2_9HYPH|nr:MULTISPECIES: LysR substrate-binding domain-containing protein [Rhizobium]TQX82755.1 LysR family transcriptional regulator [Rhizobium sp. rho-13.1]TQY05946.1 LysR family transcriptional regulator [Rhizobium sp. rho-1.1]WFS26353.1 LysR substrate-binding domain-containing protein [Rhizobium rhododendri]
MKDLNDLYYFAVVVDHGGFSPAGRALGIQKSRLSRRVLLLEQRLGVRLINRSSRHFSVTDVGRAFHERCAAMLIEAEEAEQIVAAVKSEPRGVVRMSCPSGLLSLQFSEIIARFMMQNPNIQVQLDGTNRRVDVIAEGFDLSIRVRFPPLEPTGLVMKKLDESLQCLVAAPNLLSCQIKSPVDLKSLSSLDLGRRQREYAWKLHHANGEVAIIPHSPRLVTDDMSTLRDAALSGVGAVQLPTVFICDDIKAGRLIHLLPDWRPEAGIVHAVFPSRRGLLPSVRTLVDFLAHECAVRRTHANKIVPP